jgi:predicted PurR-regulated permease PerM
VAVLAIVFAPLHVRLLRFMPKRQNLSALATVLIILALVIVPLTLTAASLVQEAANFHESMQAGTWNLGDFFKQFLAVLPSWAIDLLDRLGLKDLAAVQAKLSDALIKGSTFFASEALDIGLGTINFLVSFGIMLYLLFFFVRDGEGLARRITHAIPLRRSSRMPSSANRPPSSAPPSRATCWWPRCKALSAASSSGSWESPRRCCGPW